MQQRNDAVRRGEGVRDCLSGFVSTVLQRRRARSAGSKRVSALMCSLALSLGLPTAFAATNTPVTGVNLGAEVNDIFNYFGSNTAGAVSAINNYMKNLAATNAHWVRIEINWANTQATSSPSYNWGQADIVIKAARQNGLRVLGVILLTPPWAVSSQCPSDHLPANGGAFWVCAPDPAMYASFAAAAAKHYSSDNYSAGFGGKVDAWEVWNEPNCGAEFVPHSPSIYSQMLIKSYVLIRSANPSSVVYAGGSGDCVTSPMTPDGTLPPDSSNVAGLEHSAVKPDTWDSRDWLLAMYQDGAYGHFDALSHHPYCYVDDWQTNDQCPSNHPNTTHDFYANAFSVMWNNFPSPSYTWPNADGSMHLKSYTGTSLRTLMDTWSDGKDSRKSIVLTEFGAPTTAQDGANPFTGYLGGQYLDNADLRIEPRDSLALNLDEANQDRELKAMIDWVSNEPRGKYGPVYVYTFSDMALSLPNSTDNFEPYFGLVKMDALTTTQGQPAGPKTAYSGWQTAGANAISAHSRKSGYAPIGPGW